MRVVKSSVGVALALALVAAGAVFVPPVARAASTTGDPWYLALGDSLAAGHQPGRGDTTHGYVNELRRIVGPSIGGLRLRNLACDGETTRGMISGQGSVCRYADGSQLHAAVAFLAAHPGTVALITIDVGMNDVFARCLSDAGLPRRCVIRVMHGVANRLASIFDALRTAAGPDVPIVSMTYWDPFLGLWGLVPGGRAFARGSLRAIVAANARYEVAYGAAGVPVADVAHTFRIRDGWDSVRVPGRGRLPLNVALTCRWTWFCSPRHLGDPHPNALGYRKIAHTFAREVRPLLS
jgi:lysophospholipase L1-like esterase